MSNYPGSADPERKPRTNYNYNATEDKPANKAQAMKRQSPGDPPPWCELGHQFDPSSIGKTPANYVSDRDKSCGTPPSTPIGRQVDFAIESLKHQVDRLENHLCEIADRLYVVLRPNGPDCDGGNTSGVNVSVPVASQINNQRDRVCVAADRIVDILDRLEL